MAIDGYMFFKDYNDKFMASESQVDVNMNSETLHTTFKISDAAKGGGLFEVEDFSFDIEQTLNIGSQSTGAGAGRCTFNPFSITRKIDRASPRLFEMACSGTPFKQVVLGLRKGSGSRGGNGAPSGQLFVCFNFKLVAVKTISWSYDDESPKETTTFEYGGLQVHYTMQDPSGKMGADIPGGWNRVKNVSDTDIDKAIA